MMRSFFLFFVGILPFSSFVSAQLILEKNQNDIPDSWALIKESDYSLSYPEIFDLDKTGQIGLDVILLSKQTSQNDLFRENISLLIQNLGNKGIDLDQYVEISENQIKTMITDGHIVESKRLSKNNQSFHRVVYTGKQDPFSLKWLQYYWVKKNKAYVLTLTCEADQYDQYVELAEKVISTFKLK